MGNSKEKRIDCPLVTLALVVDEFGFPVFSQIHEGNQSELKTLEDVLKKQKTDAGNLLEDQKPVLIRERGIATKDNIALIIENKYPYTVINRRENEKDYVKEFSIIKEFIETNQTTVPEGWEVVDNENSVYITKISSDKTTCVLAASIGRGKMEQGMDALKEERFLVDIKMESALFQTPKNIWEIVHLI